ncbi:alpha/beta fold hydrolase [[Mycobacterium] wendilense]|uniref:Alpha/beta fold hydrolase n=1 Tax=[Mycobacterium] wendilense TaxID=3064284 RepID=A0ABN9NYQ6_9MYCO|nr:alpha/beta fold hydrolase [Mycolicibacterium sp. MU0050]CAJ1582899.1 alpha/beta fold hydrolase [Mycolicibacterium sp. MU0050]
MVNELAVERRGTGEPIVLLHGLGHHRHVWKPVSRLLEDNFEVIAIDLPGFAESVNVPSPPRRVKKIAAFVEQRFAEWGVHRPHVVGNSLGGAVALELGARGAARSVTALSPAGFLGPVNRFQTVGMLAALRGSRVALPWSWQHALAQRSWGRRLHAAGIYARSESLTPEDILTDMAHLKHCPSFEPVLAANVLYSYSAPVRVPTTIAWGAQDRILPIGSLRRVAAKAPGAEIQVLHGCGHVPMQDDPKTVADVVRRTAASA